MTVDNSVYTIYHFLGGEIFEKHIKKTTDDFGNNSERVAYFDDSD